MNQLKVGDIAPDFQATDQNGNVVSLNKLKGKKVILYFYPKDNTPGCTDEACNIRDNYSELTNKGFVVIGVSADSEKSHVGFANKFNLPFSLIPDGNKKIINAYGVWGEKQMYGKTYEGIHRTTFIISEAGMIESIISKVDTKNHSKQILQELMV